MPDLVYRIFCLQNEQEAKNRGYRLEILEKVYHLLDLLEEFIGVIRSG